jgi:hypothetical protein
LLEKTNEGRGAHHRYCVITMVEPTIIDVAGKFFFCLFVCWLFFNLKKKLFSLVWFGLVFFFFSPLNCFRACLGFLGSIVLGVAFCFCMAPSLHPLWI